MTEKEEFKIKALKCPGSVSFAFLCSRNKNPLGESSSFSRRGLNCLNQTLGVFEALVGIVLQVPLQLTLFQMGTKGDEKI